MAIPSDSQVFSLEMDFIGFMKASNSNKKKFKMKVQLSEHVAAKFHLLGIFWGTVYENSPQSFDKC